MNIKDINGGVARTTRSDDAQRFRSSASDGRARVHQTAIEDFFENSGQIGQARALIDALVQGPAVRAEAIERARALLASGQLDSPERVERAADGFLARGDAAAE